MPSKFMMVFSALSFIGTAVTIFVVGVKQGWFAPNVTPNAPASAPAPAPTGTNVAGNNGSCSCDMFCAKDWSGSLKSQGWVGGYCVDGFLASDPSTRIGCTTSSGQNQICVCHRDDSQPFLPGPDLGGPLSCNIASSWATGNLGACSCDTYCNQNVQNWNNQPTSHPNPATWNGAWSWAACDTTGKKIGTGDQIMDPKGQTPINCACFNDPTHNWTLNQGTCS